MATIFHNPRCSTSRNTLALMRHAGLEPTIIEYLRTPPSENELREILKKAGLKPRDIVRTKQAGYADSVLADERLDDATILKQLIKHPEFIERPLVVTDQGARLARPLEKVLEILPPLRGEFKKEDGGILAV